MKIRRDPLDTLFSDYIRERDGWVCQRCGVYCGKDSGRRFDCSHLIPRSHTLLRWDERNAVGKCFTCHKWWHSNPLEAMQWAREKLGDAHIDELLLIKTARGKLYAADKKLIAFNLKRKLAELKKLESRCATS